MTTAELLAEEIESWNNPCARAAAELRRLHAENAELVEALDKVLSTRDSNEIVGRDVDGHPLNSLGVARKHAYDLVKKAKQ